MKTLYRSIDEAETLLGPLAMKSRSLHDQALLSLPSGLKFSEISTLTWGCVNWRAGTLAIMNAKTESRTTYLTKTALSMLKSRVQGRPDELIFPKRSGKAGAMVQAPKIFADTVNELGLNDGVNDWKQGVTLHTLRHTFATHLYGSTHDLYLT